MAVDTQEPGGQAKSGFRASGVYGRIKAEILSNALPPGHQVHESDIAARLGTSRTPVREAMIRLETEGLIEVIPRRGIRVVSVSADDMREIYDILATLESLAARQLAAKRPTPADLEALSATTTDMEAALGADDLDRWASGDDSFHRTMQSLNGNGRLIAITSLLFNQAHRAQMVTIRMRRPPKQSNAEHRAIVDCLLAGDGERAAELAQAHRRRGAREMLDILENYRLPPL